METPKLLDPSTTTDAEVADVYRLQRRVVKDAAPDMPFPTQAEYIAELRNPTASRILREWVVEGGFASLMWEKDGLECYLTLCVAPESRRQGLGTLLLEFVAEQARAAGRSSLISGFYDRTGAAFAEALGARIGNVLLASTLPLPAQIAVEPVPGYTARSWQGTAPEELLGSWTKALAAINDAPRTEGRSPTKFTVESIRDHERTAAAAGMQTRVTVALSADGQVAASTEMVVGNDFGACARTEETSVAASHRRRGLARWIKEESLVSLMKDRPDVTMVQTYNDVGNAGMLAVNQKVGFKSVGRFTQVVVEL